MTTSTIVWTSVIVVVALALFAMMPDPPSISAIVPTMLNGLQTFAEAIAFAEGYGADSLNVPTRANNPGDLKLPNTAVTGAEGISVFATADDGWNALKHQLALIVNGSSHVYTLGMTIREMGAHWTDTQADVWAGNVASYLQTNGFPNVDADTPIGAVLTV
jgi:hypothetical protein